MMKIPDLLMARSAVCESKLLLQNHLLYEAMLGVILVSDYALKHAALFESIFSKPNSTQICTHQDYLSLVGSIDKSLSFNAYAAALRQLRHRCFLHLLTLEAALLANTEAIIKAWSDFADAVIIHCLDYCQQIMTSVHGVPHDEHGEVATLYAIAMGKLGGLELNYSSDIDLIFAYSSAGMTAGQEPIGNQEYFTKVVQQFVQLLQTPTVDGFVFRVDLRLRPNGESGSLVQSLSAMETYYQEQGRDWERYAMAKARVVGEEQAWFNVLIKPFVYRRYVDFSVIESLRSMKAMIEREVRLNPLLDDIKRGQGGIREIEFMIQSMQLIRGGRLPKLQSQNALSALLAIKEERLFARADALKQAYLFLRRLENVLQSQNDQQTHSLPTSELKRAQVAFSMRFDSWLSLEKKLHQYQRIVSNSFRQVLGTVDVYEDEKKLLLNQLNNVWQGHVETSMAENLLTSIGYTNAAHSYQMIHTFRHSPRCKRLSQTARLRLDRFMGILLMELASFENTDDTLLHVMNLLESIVGRSPYLALLAENTEAFRELLSWFSQSAYVSKLIVQHPFLLEVLLDQQRGWQPKSMPQLFDELKQLLSAAHDTELQEEVLRQFKLTHWLMAARAERYGHFSAARIGRFLTDVAQVIVQCIFDLACDALSMRHLEIARIKPHFAIIAYGKLGSKEMSYGSDLDLVFLYAPPVQEDALVTRLTQKIVHMLTTRTQTGVLFAVDTRLRPSGAAGLLVSSFAAFVDYQINHAWVWEHQSLLKARVICGDALVKKQLTDLKKAVVALPRDKAGLWDEIIKMRAKIEKHHEKGLIKQAPGGLLDLEFFVQFCMLAIGNISWVKDTHPMAQMRYLLDGGILNKTQYTTLIKAYKRYHQLLHAELIEPKPFDITLLQTDVSVIMTQLQLMLVI